MIKQHNQKINLNTFDSDESVLECLDELVNKMKNEIRSSINLKNFNQTDHKKITLHIVFENEFGVQMKELINVFE